MKCADGWRDACILNVSSRGLMIHSAVCARPGSQVELRGGSQVIRARVVWSKGQRAGLRSEEMLRVMDIIDLSEGRPGHQALQAARRLGRCTRLDPSRAAALGQYSRLLELGSALAIAAIVGWAVLSLGASLMLSRLGIIAAALHQ